ncbi:MAG: hypothetical protein LBG86_00185 [Puniceicoccales bacterium]|nr:hypothetical protein [Puniceicoccales bacterium]
MDDTREIMPTAILAVVSTEDVISIKNEYKLMILNNYSNEDEEGNKENQFNYSLMECLYFFGKDGKIVPVKDYVGQKTPFGILCGCLIDWGFTKMKVNSILRRMTEYPEAINIYDNEGKPIPLDTLTSNSITRNKIGSFTIGGPFTGCKDISIVTKSYDQAQNVVKILSSGSKVTATAITSDADFSFEKSAGDKPLLLYVFCELARATLAASLLSGVALLSSLIEMCISGVAITLSSILLPGIVFLAFLVLSCSFYCIYLKLG